jgi:hypothetical protein
MVSIAFPVAIPYGSQGKGEGDVQNSHREETSDILFVIYTNSYAPISYFPKRRLKMYSQRGPGRYTASAKGVGSGAAG